MRRHLSPFILWLHPLYLQGFYLDYYQTYWMNKPIHALHFRQISSSKSAAKIWCNTFCTNIQKLPHLLLPSNRSHQIRVSCSSMTKHLIHIKILRVSFIPYSGLFSRGKIFANFMNQKRFMKILPAKCLLSIGTPYNLWQFVKIFPLKNNPLYSNMQSKMYINNIINHSVQTPAV